MSTCVSRDFPAARIVKLLLFFLFVLTCALFVPMAMRALARQKHREGEWPFRVKKPLTKVEQVLYFRLIEALPDLIVLAQVPLAGFLRVRKGQTWHEWHNRISQKSVDYLICERDFRVVMAVELDDASHDSPTRAHADATKSRALTAAGVTLIRWRTTALPDEAAIRSIVADVRDRDHDGRDPVTTARIEPRLHVSRIDASNDASMDPPSAYHKETRS